MKSPLADAVKRAVDYGISNIHTCMPATIVSYDYTTQKASILPSIKLSFYDGTVLSHPVIQNVPVIFPRSGGASLTFPVEKGDGVLVVFSEHSLERWLSSSGEEVERGVNRNFDLSDAIAIVGLNSIVTPTLGTKDDVVLVYKGAKIVIKKDGSILLQNGMAKIELKADGKFDISNDEESMFSILDDTLAACAAITVGGTPIDNKSTFESLKTRFEKLL